LSLDVKQVDQSDSGFLIQFRSPYDADAETGYKLLISPSEQRLKLRAYSAEDDEVSNLSKWVTSEAIHPTGTNRIVVRCHGNNIIVNVNGAELVNVKDDSFRDGAIWFAAMAWSPQPTVATFSNILVTTP